jgi:hypothetical protein
MLSKKVILEVLCIVVLAIIVIMQFVPKVFGFTNLIDPTLLVMVKSIECRLLEKDICFLIYPEEGKSDVIITGVIMTPVAFNGYDAYLNATRPGPVDIGISSCKVSHDQCRFQFKVVDACDGATDCTLYAFIDSRITNKEHDDGEPQSKELYLRKLA